MSPALPPLRRADLRRAVVIVPNGVTLGNLFFGVWSIVAAAQGNYSRAGLYVVLGGVMDALDGRIARATRTGSRFGIELDSLVDAISFGVAPAMIMYFAVLNRDSWAWLLSFIFIASVVMRLARFNVEQGGRAKTHFHGLPSPAAGMTLATYYWFSQTPLYQQTMIGDLPWHAVMPGVMLALSWLMTSHILYPAVPTIGLRSVKGVLGILLVAGTVAGLIWAPRQFFFPALVAYIAFGLVKTIILGLLDRMPGGDPLEDEEENEDSGNERVMIVEGRPEQLMRGRGRKRRRHGRGGPESPPFDRHSSEGGE
ncbi:MAG: CDP-diacylglycerol--serine O-phosphatidyltransferase [Gemmatimonadaceae bacterium]